MPAGQNGVTKANLVAPDLAMAQIEPSWAWALPEIARRNHCHRRMMPWPAMAVAIDSFCAITWCNDMFMIYAHSGFLGLLHGSSLAALFIPHSAGEFQG